MFIQYLLILGYVQLHIIYIYIHLSAPVCITQYVSYGKASSSQGNQVQQVGICIA